MRIDGHAAHGMLRCARARVERRRRASSALEASSRALVPFCRYEHGRKTREIPLKSISHVNVLDHEKFEFALMCPHGVLAFRATDASAMAAWVAALQAKEAPMSSSPQRTAA